MSKKHISKSRASRFEKRRRGTKRLKWLVAAGSVLVVVFVSMLIFSGDDQSSKAKGPEDTDSVAVNKAEEKNKSEDTAEKTSEDESVKEEEKKSDKQQVSLEDFEELKPIEDEEGIEIEESDDPNVKKVVKKDWDVVPTEQKKSGKHQITYQEGTKDFQELKKAVRNAVNLSEDNIIYWWIGNGGSPQKAIATVSDKNETGYLRVHVQWVDGKGYKATKLEVLKEKEINR